MLDRLTHYYRRLPHYLAHRASPITSALFSRWLYQQTIPQRQDAPVIVLTMGKVGSISIVSSLLNSGVLFIKQLHRLSTRNTHLPFTDAGTLRTIWALGYLKYSHFPWLLSRPKVRIITMVREPIGRLISLYLFTYAMRFGEPIEETPLTTLHRNFKFIFDQDYYHPLVPGYFLSKEIEELCDIDLYQHPSPSHTGSSVIDQKQFSVLLMKLEVSDQKKETALSTWMNRPIKVVRRNTADEQGYRSIYAEFKQSVRIPYRYAEAIYRSSYMQHFYTPEERAKFWKRWEPQLDPTLELPEWMEKQLQEYHPPVADLPA